MSTSQERIDRIRAITGPVQELVKDRIEREPDFATALLQEAVERLVENDVVITQLLLRDVVNGTVGFRALAGATGLMDKSLMRMLSVKGNPTAKNLFLIIHALQQLNDVRLEIRAVNGHSTAGI